MNAVPGTSPPSPTGAVPALEIIGMSKTFGGQRALAGVGMTLQPGEVHGLVGQNGSGKSTLIKVLAGFHAPDAGCEIRVGGQPLTTGSQLAGDALGLRFVHQDLGLVETLDTVENLALGAGYDTGRFGLVRWNRARREAREAIDRLGYDFDVTLPVARLPMGARTAIAIARALRRHHGEPRVLVLDEPTANQLPHESTLLFELVRRVADTGVAVVLVSHRLEEVLANCSTVTVLRDGVVAAARPLAGLTETDLVELMIGQRLTGYDQPARRTPFTADGSGPVLTMHGVSTRTLRSLSLDVHPGEIVGIAGITGSGREDVASAVFGGLPRSGTVRVGAVEIEPERPDRAAAAGVGFVPADRRLTGMFPAATVGENVSVANFAGLTRWWLIRRKAERADVHRWLDRLDVRPRDPDRVVATLSGGNQQKIVLARWLRLRPRLLLLDEPTQGVDVGAKAEIHTMIDAAAREGAGVLVASTESAELARLCNRVVVIRNGMPVGVLTGDAVTEDRITAATLAGAAERV
ncbi:hypothetical protein BJF78_23780 [Pseudonocardia sp. CNS-139]|nr:hypothetical protein BJF78_23780 [Pseudonocardia sp. CNS-139]